VVHFVTNILYQVSSGGKVFCLTIVGWQRKLRRYVTIFWLIFRFLKTPLIEEAMGESERGRLKPLGATEDERQAWFSLFRGVIGAFKNPESHRDQQLKLEDAIGQILIVNTLLRKLKQDFPDKFRKEEHTSSEEDEEALPQP
jgi:hypothetical protein